MNKNGKKWIYFDKNKIILWYFMVYMIKKSYYHGSVDLKQDHSLIFNLNHNIFKNLGKKRFLF